METKPVPQKSTVEVQYVPVKLITKLEEVLKGVHERTGGYAKIHIDMVGGEVKRFECIESYLMSAL